MLRITITIIAFLSIMPLQAQTTVERTDFFRLLRPSVGNVVHRMEFDADAEGWQTQRNSRVRVQNGVLEVEAVNGFPSLYRNIDLACRTVRFVMRARTKKDSNFVINWLTHESPRRGDDKSATLSFVADNQWRNYEIELPVNGTLTNLIFELTDDKGFWEIDFIELQNQTPSPLIVKNIEETGQTLVYTIKNESLNDVTFQYNNGENLFDSVMLPPNETLKIDVPQTSKGCLAQSRLELIPENATRSVFPVFRYVPSGDTNWVRLPLVTKSGDLHIDIAEDARLSRIIDKDGSVVALIAPIVHREGVIPDFKLESNDPQTLKFSSNDVSLEINVLDADVHFSINIASGTEFSRSSAASGILEGPVLRAIGTLKGGLLCGVEYLGEGDVSSSQIDVVEPYASRFKPSRDWITLPMSVFATDKIMAALSWDSFVLQPTFASPNFIDITDGHRTSLEGWAIDATIHFEASGNVTDAIRWHVEKHGFLSPPDAPRTAEEQKALTLAALNGSVRGDDKLSWSHGAEPHWPRNPYADVLAAKWRLSGDLPLISSITPRGSVISNNAFYFVSDRVGEWLDFKNTENSNILAGMSADGTFHFRSLFPNWEKTDVAPGYSGKLTATLFEYTRITGDKRILSEAEKALNAIKSFDVPRGGHYWEAPLHTPSLLASAYLTLAFTRGFEQTQKAEYLKEAQRFALMGLPFVYQRSEKDRPILAYTTVPMYGATNRESPVLFGTPQPWTGIVYAYAINMLSKYDKEIDWKTPAKGILHAIEQMQFTDGPFIGCFPELFSLSAQQGQSWKLNPAALAMLRAEIYAAPNGMYIASDASDLVASPFSVRLTRNGMIVENAPSGVKFQIIRNGNQIIQAQGSGAKTRVSLD